MTYRGYLIDLDGTMYRGREVIPEAVSFVKELERQHIPFLFLTNNSTATQDEVAERLRGFGIPATPEHIYTSAMATATYVYDNTPSARVYAIGEKGLHHALEQKGCVLSEDEADIVIVGMDRRVTYDKLARACLLVRDGATFLSTNPDVALPSEKGFLPGNGALTSVVSVSTSVPPTYLGKPEPIIVEQALKQLGTTKDETIMIGDNYDTDIMAGIRAEIDTLLVFSGVTKRADLQGKSLRPTYQLNSLAEWEI